MIIVDAYPVVFYGVLAVITWAFVAGGIFFVAGLSNVCMHRDREIATYFWPLIIILAPPAFVISGIVDVCKNFSIYDLGQQTRNKYLKYQENRKLKKKKQEKMEQDIITSMYS